MRLIPYFSTVNSEVMKKYERAKNPDVFIEIGQT